MVIKGEGTFSLAKGENVLSVLKKKGLLQDINCDGHGTCGKCAVRFIMGAPEPTPKDRKTFSNSALKEGYRLACLAKPVQNCILEPCFAKEEEVITIDHGEVEINAIESMLDVSNQGQLCSQVILTVNPEEYGETMIVTDMGTTTIVMELVEIATGKVIDTYKTMNPQRRFGADVIGRIVHAMVGEDVLLSECMLYCLEAGAEKWTMAGFAPKLMVIAGNTIETSLALQNPVAGFTRPPFDKVQLEKVFSKIGSIPVIYMPAMAAFVGGDMLASILAMQAKEAPSKDYELLVDLGTSTELALYNNDKVVTTAITVSPSFEGGANANVPGADLISVLAKLLSSKVIDAKGGMNEQLFQKGVSVDGVMMRQEDVHVFQKAKACVYMAILELAKATDISVSDIKKVHIACGYGYEIDPEQVARIGLVPADLTEKIVADGYLTLEGAKRYADACLKDKEDELVADLLQKASNVLMPEEFDDSEDKKKAMQFS